jgi:mannose-1-phosphate guanylyltransferase
MTDSAKGLPFIPVILSGGSGSRLWPVSREQHPKPFIKMADGESLLQKAFKRAAELPGASEVLTVTNREFYFKTEDEYKKVNTGSLPTSYILEPVRRNTAPAVAAACLYAEKEYGPGTLLLILTADHLIESQATFRNAVSRAAELAADGAIVTFGIQPTSPETGYGYIEADGERVMWFVEKPSASTAKEYLAAGNYLWNAGMFCFRADQMLAEFREYSPEVLDAVEFALQDAKVLDSEDQGITQVQLQEQSFSTAPDISIDYAIMEKTRRCAVVSCDLGWSDIGNWDAFREMSDTDDNGNAIIGEALLHDVNNSYIQSNGRMIGAIGVDNLVIVDTEDALLVADRHRAQEVKHIVSHLKEANHDSYKLHTTVHRPWGTYTVLEEESHYKMKRIIVKPGASLSLQMHHHRSEHWIVVSGTAQVINGEQDKMLRPNESTYIPAGHAHRLSNPGVIDLVLIEVQTGQYLGEDDIVRFEDKYNRLES